MSRHCSLTASLLLTIASTAATCAWAGQPASSNPASQPVVVASMSPPAADRVYPPLPTLAMLPPSTGDDDIPVRTTTSRKKKARVVDCHCAMPTARLVVSDESHVYLKNLEQQLDLALAR